MRLFAAIAAMFLFVAQVAAQETDAPPAADQNPKPDAEQKPAPASEHKPAPPQDAAQTPAAANAPQRRAATSLEELKSRLLELKEIEFGGEDAPLPPVPVFVEFARSPLLSQVVAQDLRARGVRVAETKEEAAAVLALSGRVKLEGSIGRRYFDIGETFEKIAAKDPEVARIAELSPGAAAAAGARDAALARTLYEVGLFDKFLRNYFSVMALSDVLGIRGRVNTLIAGDPRGFCLTNCEHWKHIHHTLALFATVEAGDRRWKSRVIVKAWMAQIDPQPVFDVAYESLVGERLLRRSQ